MIRIARPAAAIGLITAIAGAACAGQAFAQDAPRAMVVVSERDTIREEAPPHGAIGMSTAYRISDGIEGRTMEFRKRVLHPGAEIGPHVIAHDEVYYVLDGKGEVVSDGVRRTLAAGDAAYLFTGAEVGIRQLGEEPLALIVSYPIPGK